MSFSASDSPTKSMFENKHKYHQPSISSHHFSNSNSILDRNTHDADSYYIKDCKKIQDNINSVNSIISTIEKLLRSKFLKGSINNNEFQHELRKHMDMAKSFIKDTQDLLKKCGLDSGNSIAEKNQRRLMHRKLAQNYQIALKSLETTATKCLRFEQLNTKITFNSTHSRKGKLEGIPSIVDSDEKAFNPLSVTTQECDSCQLSSEESNSVNGDKIDNLNLNCDFIPCQNQYNDQDFGDDVEINEDTPKFVIQAQNKRNLHGDIHSLIYSDRDDSFKMYYSTSSGNSVIPCDYHNKKNLCPKKTDEILLTFDSSNFDEQLLLEREEGIKQIKNDIKGINDIYTELAWHVQQQDSNIDNLENLIIGAASYASGTIRELTNVRNSSPRNFRLYVYLVGISILFGLFLFTVFSRFKLYQ